MAASVRSKVIECLAAFMRLRSNASEKQIDSWVRALPPLRPRSRASRAPVRDAKNDPFDLADAERIEVPENVVFASVQRVASPATMRFPENAVAAADLPPTEVFKRITLLIDHITEQIRSGETPYFDVPDLHSANAIYDERGNVFLGSAVRRISLHDTMAFMEILLTLELAHYIVPCGMRMTKRHVYYHHQTKIPDKRRSQTETDKALTALCNILHVRRKTLGFVAARRGLVYGSLVVRDEGQTVDVSKMSRGGWSIPGNADDVEIVESKATFILLVEKQSIALSLAQARWCETYPCIMISSVGFPSFGTRELTRRLAQTLRIPVYSLVDGDPWGIRVALTHAHGAIGTAMETPWLACDDVRWAGLYPSDVERFGLSARVEIELTAGDIESANLMLHHSSDAYVNASVRRELEVMLEHHYKTEADSLVIQDIDFFTREYLPRKLFETDLVKL